MPRTWSRLWKARRPVPASSASSVFVLCWFARPARTTVASGGVISAGGPAIRIDGESVSSGSSPSRRHVPPCRAQRQQQRQRGADQPEPRIDDPADRQRDGVGRHPLLDRVDRVERRGVEVAVGGARHEVALDDAGQRALVDVLADESGAAEQADLAVDEVVVEADQQHQAVVEAGATDAPLIHQRGGLVQVLVLADAGIDLGVDDDLGAGRRLHRVDPLLELGDDLGAQDAGLVVHGAVVHRIGERGTRRQRRGGRQDQEHERARERASPSVHDLQHTWWHPSCDQPVASGDSHALTESASRAAALVAAPHAATSELPGEPNVNTRVGALVALLIAAAVTVAATAGVAAMTVVDAAPDPNSVVDGWSRVGRAAAPTPRRGLAEPIPTKPLRSPRWPGPAATIPAPHGWIGEATVALPGDLGGRYTGEVNGHVTVCADRCVAPAGGRLVRVLLGDR